MIEVNGLTKAYGAFTAVENIDLIAKPKEITILLGPNGAGKSTTIKSIVNLLKFKGTIRICGYDNRTIQAKRCFGYIPEAPILYDLLTIDEHVEFIGRAYQCVDYKALADKYIALFHLEDKRNSIAKELSKGMRQKLSMLLALIISPRALLVDEPMVGLDPASIEETLRLFQDLKEDGVSILISTHIIDVVEEIWDVAYIMDKGQIINRVKREDTQEETLKETFFASTEGDPDESAD